MRVIFDILMVALAALAGWLLARSGMVETTPLLRWAVFSLLVLALLAFIATLIRGIRSGE